MKYFLFFIAVILFFGCFPKIVIDKGNFVHEKSLLDTCDSKECLIKVLEKDPKNVEAHWWLGTKLQAEQNYREAIKEFDAAIALDSTFNLGYPYRDRANCKNNLRNDTGALADISAAIRQDPTERYFYSQRGMYFYNLQKYESALSDFNKALDIYDKYADARVWKAKTLVILKRYGEAMYEYGVLNFSDEYVKDPDNAYDIYYRGLANFYSNNKVKACSDWTIASGNCEMAKDQLKINCK